MTQPTNNPLAYEGVAAINPANVIVAQRAPATTDVGYAYGTNWIDQPNDDVYELTSIVANVANWTLLGVSSSAVLDVVNGGTGRATLTNHGVLVGAGTSAITQLAVGATGTVLAGSTGADPAFTASPSVTGSITAGTTITATLGAITATNGNIVMSTAGNGLQVKSGANARIGVGAVLVGGTLTIANTSVTNNTVIIPVITALGTVAAPKALYVTKNAGVGFTVTSSDATDTSTFSWYMVEAT